MELRFTIQFNVKRRNKFFEYIKYSIGDYKDPNKITNYYSVNLFWGILYLSIGISKYRDEYIKQWKDKIEHETWFSK